jgi:hypothetical protein
MRDAGSQLEYIVKREHTFPSITNNSTLGLGGFEMVQNVGGSVKVPRQRTVQSQSDEYGNACPQHNLY